ncbi:MAG: hypothetical protein HY739_04950 [Desulfobacterales bacterium]|nr:hypothetical protein [Desulfobacterales bacterium]
MDKRGVRSQKSEELKGKLAILDGIKIADLLSLGVRPYAGCGREDRKPWNDNLRKNCRI